MYLGKKIKKETEYRPLPHLTVWRCFLHIKKDRRGGLEKSNT